MVLSAGARIHSTLLVHAAKAVPGLVGGFAPGTQPMGRAGEYSGCSVVWGGCVGCGVVCRRRCYQKAMAGMSTHGYR